MSVKSNHDEIILSVLKKFAEQSRDVFWIRNADYSQQIYVSPAYESIWGRSRKELYQYPHRWDEFLHPEDRLRLEKSIALRDSKVTPNDIFIEQYRIIRPDKEIRWIKDQSFPIFNNDKLLIAFAGIAQDVTENKRHETALIQAKEKAEAANQAKSNFLAVVSHEFRTPLNGILGIADILSRESLLPRQKQLIQDIILSSQHLEGIVNDVLDFSVLDAGKLNLSPQSINLHEICRRILLDFSHQLDHSTVELQFEFDKRITQNVIVDKLRLQQILVNLVNNAIKFTEKGYIKLKIKLIQSNVNDMTLKFFVTDTGVGIAPEKLSFIFENFTQINQGPYAQAKSGVGLGLAICKKLIEALGGRIRVTSKLGKGSTFSFVLNLPIAKKTKVNIASSTNTIKTKSLPFDTSYKILLVEDDKLNQKVALHFLNELNCQANLAENGHSAIELVKNNHYDLILMDINLPDVDGVTVTQRIRKQFSPSELPILAMTAYALPKEKKEFLAADMNDVITKPITLNILEKMLNKWLVYNRH